MNVFHLTFATEGRLALARDEAERRRIVRAIGSVAAGQLLSHGVVDDHLHLGARSPRPRHLARDVRRRLVRLLPWLRFEPPHVRPVESRDHLERVVRYHLQQPARHGVVGANAALWTGSSFLDLVGARLLPGFDVGLLQSELPRLRARDLFAAVGLDPVPLEPASDDALRRAGAARIVELAAAVHVVGPELSGRERPVVAARVLAVHIAEACGVPVPEVGRFLGVVQSTTWRLARRPHDPRAERCLRIRLTLESRVAAAIRSDPRPAA